MSPLRNITFSILLINLVVDSITQLAAIYRLTHLTSVLCVKLRTTGIELR